MVYVHLHSIKLVLNDSKEKLPEPQATKNKREKYYKF